MTIPVTAVRQDVDDLNYLQALAFQRRLFIETGWHGYIHKALNGFWGVWA